jgi:hypothetical protein
MIHGKWPRKTGVGSSIAQGIHIRLESVIHPWLTIGTTEFFYAPQSVGSGGEPSGRMVAVSELDSGYEIAKR